jgi:Uma2 family endonuclease
VSSVQLRRWTRQEYDRMIDAGILGPSDRVELIEGEIIEMSPQKPPHAICIELTDDALRRIFRDGFRIRIQLPLALEDSEPEPDLAVVRGSIRDNPTEHPSTAVLVVEVADATLDYDRRRKARVYARAGIPEYWLVNLVDYEVEVYRDPSPDGHYAAVQRVNASNSVSPLAASWAEVAVTALLP